MANHEFICDGCGAVAHTTATWRLRNPPVLCLACVRVKNRWSCPTCDSADPLHPLTCTAE